MAFVLIVIKEPNTFTETSYPSRAAALVESNQAIQRMNDEGVVGAVKVNYVDRSGTNHYVWSEVSVALMGQ